jgi:hypothetical protein
MLLYVGLGLRLDDKCAPCLARFKSSLSEKSATVLVLRQSAVVLEIVRSDDVHHNPSAQLFHREQQRRLEFIPE